MLVAQHGGRLHRQAGLARPARADQRHEPARADRLAQLRQLGVAADEAAQPLPQVARRSPAQRPSRSPRTERGPRRWPRRAPGPGPGCGPGVLARPGRGRCPARRPGGHGLRRRRAGPRPGVRPVQGQDEQLPQALAQRVFPAQRLQLADELPVPPQHQVRAGAGLDRHQGQLVQMRPFGVSEAGIGELGQRLPPPQRRAPRPASLTPIASSPSSTSCRPLPTSCSKRTTST